MIRRFRKFSLRTLVIFVTLICAYFGAWEATHQATLVERSSHELSEITVPVPFLIVRDQYDHSWMFDVRLERQFWLWLFGYEVRLYRQERLDIFPTPAIDDVQASVRENGAHDISAVRLD